MTQERNTVVLGATGALGVLGIERYRKTTNTHVIALAAYGNHLPELAQQAVEREVYGLAVHEGSVEQVHRALDHANQKQRKEVRPEILIGPESAVQAAAAGANEVLNAIRGIHGLRPSVAALEAGSSLVLANSESLLAKDLLEQYIPHGDSLGEHVQLLNPDLVGIQQTLNTHQVARIVLTSRTKSISSTHRRPTVQRVNSLMGFNSAIAMCELRAITDVPIEFVEHDGPVGAIMELADGRTIFTPRRHLNTTWAGSTQWKFKEISHPASPSVDAVLKEGGVYPLALYRAHNLAVQAYVEGAIELEQVEQVVGTVMDDLRAPEHISVQSVIESAHEVEELAMEAVERHATTSGKS